MLPPTPPEVLTTLQDFVIRVDVLDPTAPPWGEIEVRLDGHEACIALRAPVARALVEALRGYHDPRDHGHCDHCGGRRLSDDLVCGDCGRPNGLFGQMIEERAARYGEPEAILP